MELNGNYFVRDKGERLSNFAEVQQIAGQNYYVNDSGDMVLMSNCKCCVIFSDRCPVDAHRRMAEIESELGINYATVYRQQRRRSQVVADRRHERLD